MCARHGVHLGGASPPLSQSVEIMILCKRVHIKVNSEVSKWRNLLTSVLVKKLLELIFL